MQDLGDVSAFRAQGGGGHLQWLRLHVKGSLSRRSCDLVSKVIDKVPILVATSSPAKVQKSLTCYP